MNTEKITKTLLKSFSEVADIANDSGIRSTLQLKVFLSCSSREGESLSDIFNLAPDTSEYRQQYTMARQLMLGASNRGYNGANLLAWGNNLYGKERGIVLTIKGRKLLKEITKILTKEQR